MAITFTGPPVPPRRRRKPRPRPAPGLDPARARRECVERFSRAWAAVYLERVQAYAVARAKHAELVTALRAELAAAGGVVTETREACRQARETFDLRRMPGDQAVLEAAGAAHEAALAEYARIRAELERAVRS